MCFVRAAAIDQEAVNAHIRGIFGIETGFKGTIFSEAAMLTVRYSRFILLFVLQLQNKDSHHRPGTKTNATKT
jgi:hypothetical protein